MPPKTEEKPAAKAAVKKSTPTYEGAMRSIDNKYGDALHSQAEALGIDVAIAAAVLQVESAGSAFHNVDGEQKATIRFENHVFWRKYTNGGKDKAKQASFDEHFQFDPKERWKGHRWRASDSGSWTDCHKSQKGEYDQFEYAKRLDETAAYESISTGMGQIMGEGHALAGKSSAKAMYDDFNSGEQAQIDGTFAFIKNKADGKALKALKDGDFSTFVHYYNGSKPGTPKNEDYTQKLVAAAEAYRRVAAAPSKATATPPPTSPLGRSEALLHNSELHAAKFRRVGWDGGSGEHGPLERMGVHRRLTLATFDAPAPPDPRQSDFSKGARKVSTGLTVAGVGAAGVKIGLGMAGGFATAVSGLGLAGGILGLLNFATKIADGTLNDPLAEQTILKHADRLGALGEWLKRHEAQVKAEAVLSNWLGAGAGALSVAAGTMALTGVGLPVAAVLGAVATGLTIGSVLTNPAGVVGVGLKVYDGLRFMGRIAVEGLDLALYGGMKAVGGAIKIGGKAAEFARETAKGVWWKAKAGAGWLGHKGLGLAHEAAGIARAGAGYVARKGQQAWGAAKAVAGLADEKRIQAFAWLMRNRLLMVDVVESFEADASAASVMGFAAAAAMAVGGLLFPPLLPVAASTAVVAEALSIVSGSAGYLKAGLVALGMADDSVPPEVAYHALGEGAVKFVASFFGGRIVERMGKAVKAATQAEGSVIQKGTHLSAESQAKILVDKATDTEKKAPYAVVDPFLKRLENMMASGLDRYLASPFAPLMPFYGAAVAIKGVLSLVGVVNKGLAWLSGVAGKAIRATVDAVGTGLHKAGEGAAWLGGKIKAGFNMAKGGAADAAHFAKDRAAGAWGWLKQKGAAAVDKAYDVAGAGIAAGFGLVGDLARKRQLGLPPKIVGGIPDGGLTGVFPASGAPPDEAANDSHRHAAIAGGATIFVNGVLNTLEEHVHSARRLAHETKNPVVGVFNASDLQLGKSGKGETGGTGLGDFVESVDDTTSLDSVNPAIKTMTDLLLKYGDPELPPKGKLNVVAHSQGSIILSKALWRASNQKKGNLAKIDATTFGNATFFFPKGANYHHYVFDDDVIANKLGTNSGAEKFFNGTRLGKAVSKRTARRITGQDDPEVDDAVAHTTILHQGGAGKRPHGMSAGYDLAPDGKGGYERVSGGDYDGKDDYISSLSTFQTLEGAQAGKLKERQTERGRIGVNNAFGKGISDWLSKKAEGLGKGMKGLGLSRSGGLVESVGKRGRSRGPNAVDEDLFARSGQKVQRRSPDAGPEPNAGGIVERVLGAGEGHRTVDATLAARLGAGFQPGARLHVGPAAAGAARSLGAEAFTAGGDVFFGAGRFDPHSEGGMGLLAHELTHVGQQTGDDARLYTPSGGDALERQAQAAERTFGARAAGLSVGQVRLELDEEVGGHGNRLAGLASLAVDAAGAELGEMPGEIESLALDLSLDVETMSDAEIVDALRRQIVQGVRLAAPAVQPPATTAMQLKKHEPPPVSESDLPSLAKLEEPTSEASAAASAYRVAKVKIVGGYDAHKTMAEVAGGFWGGVSKLFGGAKLPSYDIWLAPAEEAKHAYARFTMAAYPDALSLAQSASQKADAARESVRAFSQANDKGADRAIATLTTVRDASFATVAAGTAVLAAPVALAMGGAAAGSLGAGGAVATAAGWATAGVAGAGVGGAVRGGLSLTGNAAGQGLSIATQGGKFNSESMLQEGASGYKAGAVDGATAVLGLGMGKLLGTGKTLAGDLMRKGGAQAISGGAAGGANAALNLPESGSDGKPLTAGEAARIVGEKTLIGSLTSFVTGAASAKLTFSGATPTLGRQLMVEGGANLATGGAAGAYDEHKAAKAENREVDWTKVGLTTIAGGAVSTVHGAASARSKSSGPSTAEVMDRVALNLRQNPNQKVADLMQESTVQRWLAVREANDAFRNDGLHEELQKRLGELDAGEEPQVREIKQGSVRSAVSSAWSKIRSLFAKEAKRSAIGHAIPGSERNFTTTGESFSVRFSTGRFGTFQLGIFRTHEEAHSFVRMWQGISPEAIRQRLGLPLVWNDGSQGNALAAFDVYRLPENTSVEQSRVQPQPDRGVRRADVKGPVVWLEGGPVLMGGNTQWKTGSSTSAKKAERLETVPFEPGPVEATSSDYQKVLKATVHVIKHGVTADSPDVKPVIQPKRGLVAGTSQATAITGGLPAELRSGIESHSGFDMGDVRVRYNSARPAGIGALAYAQGKDIHLAPGQERHLPHEAWHVVQQMQGRVRPTLQMKGASINDDSGLEAEADAMGALLARSPSSMMHTPFGLRRGSTIGSSPVQRVGGKGVGQPGFWGSMIPIYGSGRAAVDDFQSRRWGWGAFNTAMAISDVFMVGTLAKSLGKIGLKFGARTFATSGAKHTAELKAIESSAARSEVAQTGAKRLAETSSPEGAAKVRGGHGLSRHGAHRPVEELRQDAMKFKKTKTKFDSDAIHDEAIKKADEALSKSPGSSTIRVDKEGNAHLPRNATTVEGPPTGTGRGFDKHGNPTEQLPNSTVVTDMSKRNVSEISGVTEYPSSKPIGNETKYPTVGKANPPKGK